MIRNISRVLAIHLALPAVLLFTTGSQPALAQANTGGDAQNGKLEKMAVATGTVAMQVDWSRVNGTAASKGGAKSEPLQFRSGPSSFMTALVFNGEFRTIEGGNIALVPMDSASVPELLQGSLARLVIERMPDSDAFELAVRDSATGFVFFNIDRNRYQYDANATALRMDEARLLISPELARQLGRPAAAGMAVGTIAMQASLYPIEVTAVVNGEAASVVLPTRDRAAESDEPALVNGPDVIVGDIPSMQQFGSVGSQVGLGIGTTSCNAGNVPLNWYAMPNTDHPVIPQNLYRMSANADRMEQVGQSWLKHAFTALQNNACGFGCTATGGTMLGTGCSDPYSAGLNASQSGLGSRAWVNPFTGAYPSTARDHTNHTHTTISHLVLVNAADLNTSLNPGATYFAEAQYVTPHEYAWCQSRPGECNMYNNVSYRRFTVSGTTSFSFSAADVTQRSKTAISAWTGATVNQVEPVPGVDGQAFVAYKVTGPVDGMYHYEYAVYNQNLDRAIRGFTVPLGCGVNTSNVGFRAPVNEPGSLNDGTVNSAGISNTPWTPLQTSSAIAWSTQTIAENPNANALRWGLMFNFRFDSDRPPTAATATLDFFKTGNPVTVAIQAPSAACTALQVATVVSRKAHGAGTYDVDMPLGPGGGVECRSGGANGNHTLVVTFSNNVMSGNASLTAAGGGSISSAPSFSGNTMTINLANVADVQQTVVTLSGVTDNFGQTLPDTMVNVSFLYGDTNGDRTVNISDTLQTRSRAGQTLDGTNFRSDVNTDGALNSGDTVVVRARSGNSLLAPPPVKLADL